MPITKLDLWVQSVLPTVYDDSLSYLEFLGKVMATVNALIDSDEETRVLVNTFIANTDQTITQIIDQVLRDLIADGSIADIITNEVLVTKANQSDMSAVLIDVDEAQSDITGIQSTLNLKAFSDNVPTIGDFNVLNTKVDSLSSASPKGVYATLGALETALPTGATGVYVVTATGGWYYWSGSAWTLGGTYQSTATIASGVTNTPAGSIVSANVQGAINELDIAKRVWESGLSLPLNQNKKEGTLTPTILAISVENDYKPLVTIVEDAESPVRNFYRYNHRITRTLATSSVQMSQSNTIPDLSSKPSVISLGFWVKDGEINTLYATNRLMAFWLYGTAKYIKFKFDVKTLIGAIGNTGTGTNQIVVAGLIDSFTCAVKCLHKVNGFSYVRVDLNSIVWNSAFADFTLVKLYHIYEDVYTQLLNNTLNMYGITLLYGSSIANGFYVYGDGDKIEQKPYATGVYGKIDTIAGNVLYGKVLAVAGDSIVSASNPNGGLFKSFGEVMANRNGMPFYNYGISGSTMTNVVGTNPFSVGRYLAMVDALDYLIIWFGWNDSAYATVGTITDAVNTTFYGAWNIVLPALIQKYPLAKIGLVVPYGTNNAIQQAVRDIGRKFGVPYLDTEASGVPMFYLRNDTAVDATIEQFRRSTFTYDGTHPNQAGHTYISTIIENFIRSL